jgi:hypothetical protein
LELELHPVEVKGRNAKHFTVIVCKQVVLPRHQVFTLDPVVEINLLQLIAAGNNVDDAEAAAE